MHSRVNYRMEDNSNEKLSRKALNAKELKIYLKQNLGTLEVAKKYECTEVELLDWIERIFPPGLSRDFIAKLKKNSKQNKKINKNSTAAIQEVGEETIDDSEKICSKLDLELNDDISQMNGNELEEADKNDSAEEINNLKIANENISNQIVEEELKRKEVVAERKDIYDNLLLIKDEQIKIQESLKKSEKKFNELSAKLEATCPKLVECNQKINKLKTDLEKNNEKLQKLQKIQIFVFNDGGINIESVSEVEIPESWKEINEKLTEEATTNPIFEDLTIRQIKQISKLLVLTASIENFELIFDVDIVEHIYMEIINNNIVII